VFLILGKRKIRWDQQRGVNIEEERSEGKPLKDQLLPDSSAALSLLQLERVVSGEGLKRIR